MVVKEDMFLYFYCFIYAYYMVSLLQHHILYIHIMLVLLLYLLLPPLFYHSLGRFLTTLGLRAQVGIRDIILSDRSLDSHRGLVNHTIHRYLDSFVLLPYLSIFLYLSCSLTPFLQVFLYLFAAGTFINTEVISCTEA